MHHWENVVVMHHKANTTMMNHKENVGVMLGVNVQPSAPA